MFAMLQDTTVRNNKAIQRNEGRKKVIKETPVSL